MTDLQTLYGHLKTLNKQWFYDKDEIDALLDDKLDEVDIPTKTSDLENDGDGTNDFITTSNTEGLIKNDGTIDTSDYVESSDLHAVATSGDYTDLENIPESFAPTAHEHSVGDIVDSNAYSNLGTTANSTQSAINFAIDSRIGSLLSVELIELVDTLGTASASTMNKIYIKPEQTAQSNDAYEVFITVKTADEVEEGEEQTYSYAWEKIDTARIDLSGKASSDHVHGNLTNDGKIGSNANYFVYTTTGGAVTSKQTIGNITTDGAIGSASGKVLVTTTNGVITVSDNITEMDNTIQSLITYGNSLSNSGNGGE